MKYILIIITILIPLLTLGQQAQIEDEPFYYQVEGLVYVKKFNKEERKPTEEQKIPEAPLKFKIVKKEVRGDNIIYYVIQFLPITSDKVVKNGKEINYFNSSAFVNGSDNGNYFWLDKSELDSYIADKFILKSFRIPNTKLAYGASVSLPFKLRPKIDEQNIKITPDITLGGYLGLKWRLSHSQPFYVTAPMVTLGLATLALNDNTSQSTTKKGDGLVLGITRSLGAVFQFNDFQFGFMYGRDTAAGELGKDWIYNNKDWFSFSIGFSFLGNKPEEKKPVVD